MAIQGASHGLRGRGGFNVGVRLEGDWFKLRELVNHQELWLRTAAIEGQLKFAQKYKKEVKKNIANGGKRFGYSNSPKYVAAKARSGGGTTTLVWSKSMHDNVVVKYNKVGGLTLVGIPKGIKRETYRKGDNNKLEVHEYANVLEHRYPKKPVFTDTFRAIGGKAKIASTVQAYIIKNYLKRGFKIFKA